MKRLFRKGDRVRNKMDGKIMEVSKYAQANRIWVKWYDLESKEVYSNTVAVGNLIREF